VTEKGSNLIDTYAVNANGIASAAVTSPSHGATPFGFGFSPNGLLIVSEAFGGAPDASALSSYEINRTSGALRVVSPSVGTTETSACWIAVTPSGRYVYTANAVSGTITGYAISQGTLTLLTPGGVTGNAGAGSSPIDLGITTKGEFLYTLASATHAIVGFSVAANGSLAPIGNATGLPAGTNGLAVR
jgi:6-phosphogluconolactonase (cycloisomerase 2 family)